MDLFTFRHDRGGWLPLMKELHRSAEETFGERSDVARTLGEVVEALEQLKDDIQRKF